MPRSVPAGAGLASAPMDSRIAIVNRGEPARRLIHAARELNHERGWAIRTIALHTAEERRATFVREADEAVVIGRAGAGNPYLDHAELERALRELRRRRRLGRLGLRRRGPGVRGAVRADRRDVHRPAAGGDAPARRQDRGQVAGRARSGVPVAAVERRPGGRPMEDGAAARRGHRLPADDQGRAAAAAAAASGWCRVRGELEEALERARVEAERAFGDATCFMERLVAGGRHVEVQVDRRQLRHGLGARRARLLRPAAQPEGDRGVGLPGADAGAGARRCARAAVALVQAAGYRGAGTVEFLYQPDGAALHLPGGQHAPAGGAPGHRGDDRPRPGQAAAPRRRRRPARGRPAAGARATRSRPGSTPRTPSRASRRRPGRVELLRPADRARASGWTPGVARGRRRSRREYDSMIAKVIAWGRDRAEALARLRCALRETTVVVRGGTTTSPSCSTCSTGPRWWRAPPTPAGWTAPAAERRRRSRPPRRRGAASRRRSTPTTPRRPWSAARFLASARGGRPRARARGRPHGGAGLPRRRSYRLTVAQIGAAAATGSSVDGRLVDVDVDRLGRAREPAHASADAAYRGRRRRQAAGPPGRGGRRHPPRLPRRGRRGARAGARGRRGGAGRGRARRSRPGDASPSSRA